MFRSLLIVFMILLTTSCKQEDVSFNALDNQDRVDPSSPPVNAGGGEEVPVVGPEIVFLQRPVDHIEGERTSVVYQVKAGDHPISSLQCFLDGSPLVCEQEDNILFKNLAIGAHEFKIEVSDEAGLSDVNVVGWKIVRSYQSKVQFVKVNTDERDTDILFVIDNSRSMDAEQRKVGNKISRLFESVKGLTWRIGIISTDPYEFDPITNQYNPLSDGMLLKFPGNRYYIDSSLNEQQAKNFFVQTINRPEGGNGHERGIHNTYRSIERTMSSSNDSADLLLKNFFRPKASLSVVLVSDENETFRDGAGVPFSDLERSDGNELISLVTRKWGPEKRFQFNSIIVRDGDLSCIKQDESFGLAYEALSRSTGGVVEDICSRDYNNVLKNIGKGIVDIHKVYPLECIPQDTNGDGQVDLQVISPTGQTVPGYVLDGQKIEFDQPLSSGDYQILYSCVDFVPN